MRDAGRWKTWLTLIGAAALAAAVAALPDVGWPHDLPGSVPVVFPDPVLTPGAAAPVTEKVVCRPGYAKARRRVSEATKREVFAAYGIPYDRRAEYEVDHLIPLELGGANDARNLWPQSYSQKLGARQKDRAENWLRREVCAGRVPLEQAQRRMARNWYSVYLECCVPGGKPADAPANPGFSAH